MPYRSLHLIRRASLSPCTRPPLHQRQQRKRNVRSQRSPSCTAAIIRQRNGSRYSPPGNCNHRLWHQLHYIGIRDPRYLFLLLHSLRTSCVSLVSSGCYRRHLSQRGQARETHRLPPAPATRSDVTAAQQYVQPCISAQIIIPCSSPQRSAAMNQTGTSRGPYTHFAAHPYPLHHLCLCPRRHKIHQAHFAVLRLERRLNHQSVRLCYLCAHPPIIFSRPRVAALISNQSIGPSQLS